MNKKPSPGTRQLQSSLLRDDLPLRRCDVPPRDLWLHARSFHSAAKKLGATLELDANTLNDFNICPVVFMYRHAIELHLKALILGDGGNFLATKPDSLSIQKTHSVSWLAQFVCQIITTLKWESDFKCEGIANLAEFKAVIEESNSVDPGSYVFRLPVVTSGAGAPSSIREYARRMDVLLVLLNDTADALAATCDMRNEPSVPDNELDDGDNFQLTIQ